MKKHITVIMAAAGMALLATACSKNTAEESTVAETESSAEEASENEAEASEDAAESETVESAEKGNGTKEQITQTSENGLKVKITTIDSETTTASEGDKKLDYSGSFDTISVTDDGYDALNKSIKASDDAVKATYDADYADNKSFMEESLELADDGEMSWSMSNFVNLVRCDDTVFSYFRTDDSYLGGAHPNSYIIGYNFDSKTGDELKLSDVVTDYDKAYEFVLSELDKMQQEEDWLEYFDDYKDSVNRMFYGTDVNEADTDAYETYGSEPSIQWTMDENSIHITFNRYDIASYAMGTIDVVIPYSSELLNKNYFKAE